MSFLARSVLAAAVALTLGIAPALSADAKISPVGTWQTSGGDARFKVSLCGDGTQLCAKLTWLRADARSDENLRYLNKYVVRGAKPVDDNKWRGTVNYNGESISGQVTLAGNQMSLQGCKGIFCQSMQFQRL